MIKIGRHCPKCPEPDRRDLSTYGLASPKKDPITGHFDSLDYGLLAICGKCGWVGNVDTITLKEDW